MILQKPPPTVRLPLFIFKFLRMIPGSIKNKVTKLLDDERYSSSKIESLGFSAKLRFGNLNETLF
jgi:hypothetical protein